MYINNFWNNVDKQGESDCWNWKASLQKSGYGNSYSEQGVETAHRISYKLCYGEIPQGKEIMHLCDNRRCVNPKHLVLGSRKDNMIDCSKKGRLNPNSLKNLTHRLQKGYIPSIKGTRNIIWNCLYCNKEKTTLISRKRTFCSQKCNADYRKENRNLELK